MSSASSHVPVELLSLPNEVLIEIAGHLTYQSSNEVIFLLQSCRRLHDTCLPVLYASPHLRFSTQLQQFVAVLHERPALAHHTFRLSILFAEQDGGHLTLPDLAASEPPILPNCTELECTGVKERDILGDHWFCRSLEWAICCPKLKLLRFCSSDWWTSAYFQGEWKLKPGVAALHQKGIKVAPSLNTLSLGNARGTLTFFGPRPSSYPPQGFLNLRWVQHLILDQCCDSFPMEGYQTRSLENIRTLSMQPHAYEAHDCFAAIAGSFPNLEVMECGLPRNIDSIIFPKTVRELTFILPETGEYLYPESILPETRYFFRREDVLGRRMRHLENIISNGTLPQLKFLRLKTGAEGMLDGRVPAEVRWTLLDIACATAGVNLQLQLR